MGFPQALVTFPGIKEIVSFEYSREHGISPGMAMLTLVPQKGWPAKRGPLTLTFGNFRLSMRDFFPDKLSFQFDQSGFLYKLRLLDRRIAWRYGKISGRYNLRLPNGPVDKIDPRTEATPETLIKQCLKAMGETKYNIAVDYLPDTWRPTVEWDYSSPAQELANLCDQFGMRVVLRMNDSVAIVPKGRGGLSGERAPLLPPGPIIQDSGNFDPPEKPKKIKFVCGGTRTEVDLSCEAVGDDIDGLVKPIDDLTYAPPGGWTTCPDLVAFLGVPLTPNNVNVNDAWNTLCSPRELAKQSIYRKYRITINDMNGKPVRPPGFKKNLEDVRQLLPFGTQLIEPTFDPDTGWYKPVQTIIWGAYARGNVNSHDVTEIERKDGSQVFLPIPIIKPKIDPVTGAKLTTFDTTAFAPDEWSIDPDTGIITFSRQVYRYFNNTDPSKQLIKPAIILIRAAVTVSDPVTFTVNRYEVDRELSNPTINDDYIVKDEDLFVRYVPTHYEKGNHSTQDGFSDNIQTVKKYANERLDAEERKFMTLGPRSVRYAGWQLVEMDGGVHQVAYSMSQAGAFTDACLNDELAVLTVSYSDRRFIEKLNGDKMNAVVNAANKLASEKAFAFSKVSGLTRTQR